MKSEKTEDHNPWQVPFALADFMVPTVKKALSRFEKQFKPLLENREYKVVMPIENTLALMILVCFMWPDEVANGELSKTFEIAQTTVKKLFDDNVIPDLKNVN